jgi:hypothetical protein
MHVYSIIHSLQDLGAAMDTLGGHLLKKVHIVFSLQLYANVLMCVSGLQRDAQAALDYLLAHDELSQRPIVLNPSNTILRSLTPRDPDYVWSITRGRSRDRSH